MGPWLSAVTRLCRETPLVYHGANILGLTDRNLDAQGDVYWEKCKDQSQKSSDGGRHVRSVATRGG